MHEQIMAEYMNAQVEANKTLGTSVEALVRLLVNKGVFTKNEYSEKLAECKAFYDNEINKLMVAEKGEDIWKKIVKDKKIGEG